MDLALLKSSDENQTNPRNTPGKYFNTMYLTVISTPSCCTDERFSFCTSASMTKTKENKLNKVL